MNFAKLKHKIVFLKPEMNGNNDMSESLVKWFPFHPARDISEKALYVTSDNKIQFDSGVLRGINDVFSSCGIRADVSPTSGREFLEAQKISEETTYKINTRYFKDICSNMKILYGMKVFNIISVLDLGEEHRQLQLVCTLSE